MTEQERLQVLDSFRNDMTEEKLWDVIVAYQGVPFQTVSGLPFQYEIKRGRNGEYNKELIVSRRTDSKTIVWSSIRLAFNNALKHKGTVVPRPKALGDIRGISYIYPLLHEFGVIEVPEG
ncbi:MAG: hypothetical protein IJ757_09180 [Clostridiales bacterium]|nr:hypothetical protein [Clostridiales bacterium]